LSPKLPPGTPFKRHVGSQSWHQECPPGAPFKSNLWSQTCHQNCRQRRSSAAALGTKIAGTSFAKNAYEELPWEPKLKPKLRPGTPFKSHVGSQNWHQECPPGALIQAQLGSHNCRQRRS
jgi:hypothetical protein